MRVRRSPAAPRRPAAPDRRWAKIRIGVHRPTAGRHGPPAHPVNPPRHEVATPYGPPVCARGRVQANQCD